MGLDVISCINSTCDGRSLSECYKDVPNQLSIMERIYANSRMRNYTATSLRDSLTSFIKTTMVNATKKNEIHG